MFEEDILEYIKQRGPSPITKMSRDLQIGFTETTVAIRKLHREGKIRLVNPSKRKHIIHPPHTKPRTIIPPFKPKALIRKINAQNTTDIHIYPPPSEREREIMKFRKNLKRIIDEYRSAHLNRSLEK